MTKFLEHQADIMAMHEAGESYRAIARKYNTDHTTLKKWVDKWKEDPTASSRHGITRAEDEKRQSKSIPDPEPGINPADVRRCQRFVVTSALNNCEVHTAFLHSLQNYCATENAQLLVVPVAYKNVSLFSGSYTPEWPSELDQYYITQDIELSSNLVIMGSMRIQATAARPLQGTLGISKGRSAIFGHPRLALETVATPMDRIPLVYMTTGTVSKASYSDTKAGRLGEFHHNPGAVIVETDGNLFWWRMVHPDKFGSFIDIDKQYGPDGSVFPAPPAEAVIVGDVHVGFDDLSVIRSIFDELVPRTYAKNVILHDLLDFFSGSHHHVNNTVLKVLKNARGRHSVYSELKSVADFLLQYCKEGTLFHVIRSNHHDHYDKWLDNNSAAIDAENLWLWHHANAQRLREALDIAHDPKKQHQWGVTSAFELAIRALLPPRLMERISFADDKTPLEFAGIDCSNHGDKGPNGSRGSRSGFARVQRKTFIGHSHSPGIHDGCYQVGKSSQNEQYLSGYSSHLHCSGIIYADGNRTLFPIIDGKIHRKGDL